MLGMSDGLPGTHNPLMAAAEARTAERALGGAPVWSPFAGGVADYYLGMGQTAENVAQFEGVSRLEQDEFAAMSQQRAGAAQARGFFEREITGIETVDADGNPVIITQDDCIRAGTTLEKLSELKPAFRPDGTVTAGNACPLNDGAAAVIVMSDTRARELGLTPIARIISSGVSGVNPEIMGLGPIDACRQAMARAGMTIDDIDLVEINEAFAAQVVPSAKHLGISWDKLNINGGAIALGHPFGMTGARIMATLLNALEDTGKTVGMESMCIGGGQGMAMIVERLA
jgi:acetyl-CoA C-acetyltransferase